MERRKPKVIAYQKKGGTIFCHSTLIVIWIKAAEKSTETIWKMPSISSLLRNIRAPHKLNAIQYTQIQMCINFSPNTLNNFDFSRAKKKLLRSAFGMCDVGLCFFLLFLFFSLSAMRMKEKRQENVFLSFRHLRIEMPQTHLLKKLSQFSLNVYFYATMRANPQAKYDERNKI